MDISDYVEIDISLFKDFYMEFKYSVCVIGYEKKIDPDYLLEYIKGRHNSNSEEFMFIIDLNTDKNLNDFSCLYDDNMLDFICRSHIIEPINISSDIKHISSTEDIDFIANKCKNMLSSGMGIGDNIKYTMDMLWYI